MKKLFFYSNHREFDNTLGITQKVHSEIEAFKRLGYSVTYSAYTYDGAGIFDEKGNNLYSKKQRIKNTKISRLLRRRLLINCCKEYLRSNNEQYTIAYLRFHFFDRIYVALLTELKKHGCFNVVEAHAYPYKSFDSLTYLPIYIKDYIFTPFARQKIDLVAVMSKAQHPWGVESVQIDNGIDLDKYRVKKDTSTGNALRIIAVANETRFHAYDKVIKGLKQYYENNGDKNIVITFVGAYMESTRALVKECQLEKHCRFVGKMFGTELDKVFDENDIGLGAFSHRKDDSGSCIKTKEYFARGIPFVNGWKEPAFDDTYPYVLRFNTENETIDFFMIEKFHDKLLKDRDVSQNMRQFAEDNYTWDRQMKIVEDAVKKIKKRIDDT